MSLIFKKKLPIGHFLTFSSKPTLKFAQVKQVHGTTILLADNQEQEQEGDGIVTSPDLNCNLAIQTADCLAVAVIGHRGCALLHAGWRGLQQNIIDQQRVKDIVPYYFFIGPSIQVKSFQVTEEFREYFPHSSHLFVNGGFNLQQELKDQIAKSYQKAQVEDCGLDTFSDNRFHSYRRDKTALRNWNLLVNKL